MPAGSGLRPARVAPRSGFLGSWSCTARPAPVATGGSPRLATARPPAGGRLREARTTRPLPGPEVRSRCPGGSPERREVSPLVARFQRITVVRRVRAIDLDGAVPGQEGGERLVDERRIRELRSGLPRV